MMVYWTTSLHRVPHLRHEIAARVYALRVMDDPYAKPMTSLQGHDLLGFSHPDIVAHINALPGLHLCSDYRADVFRPSRQYKGWSIKSERRKVCAGSLSM